MLGNSSGIILKFRKKRKSLSCVHVLEVPRRGRATTAKKCDARAGLLFCKSKPTSFLPFSLPLPLPLPLPSPSSLLKLPNIC